MSRITGQTRPPTAPILPDPPDKAVGDRKIPFVFTMRIKCLSQSDSRSVIAFHLRQIKHQHTMSFSSRYDTICSSTSLGRKSIEAIVEELPFRSPRLDAYF